MVANDLVGDAQAQPHPFGLVAFIAPFEGQHHLFDLIAGDALAAVHDGDDGLFAAVIAQKDLGIFAVFEAVVDDVGQGTTQLLGLADHEAAGLGGKLDGGGRR